MHVGHGVRDELDEDVEAEEHEGDEVDPEGGHGPLLGAAKVRRRHRPAAGSDADGLRQLVLPVVPVQEQESVPRARDKQRFRWHPPHLTELAPFCSRIPIFFILFFSSTASPSSIFFPLNMLGMFCSFFFVAGHRS